MSLGIPDFETLCRRGQLRASLKGWLPWASKGKGNSVSMTEAASERFGALSLSRSVGRFRNNPIAMRLARGVAWSTSGSLIARLIMLISSFILARILGASGFGAFGIIQSTSAMFQMLAIFGLGVTTAKYVAQHRVTEPSRAGAIIGFLLGISALTGAIAALALYACSPWLASKSLANPELSQLLRICAAMLMAATFNSVQTGALQGLEAFRQIAQLNVFNGIIFLLFCSTGVLIAGLPGTVWALAAAALISCIASHYVLVRQCRALGIKIKWDHRGHTAILHRFALPALLGSAVVVPANWICNAILVNQKNGYAEMGVFNAANQWFTAIVFLPSILAGVLLPVLSEQSGRARSFRRILRASVAVNAAVVLPLLAAILIAGPWIMKAYGKGYAGGGVTLTICVFTAALVALENPVGQILAATDKMWQGFAINAAWATVFLCSMYLLRNAGANGLAFSRLIAYAAHILWSFTLAFVVIHRMEKPFENVSF